MINIGQTFVAALFCTLGSAAHAQTKVVEGIVSHGALNWPEYVATEFGWMKENGVDLDSGGVFDGGRGKQP